MFFVCNKACWMCHPPHKNNQNKPLWRASLDNFCHHWYYLNLKMNNQVCLDLMGLTWFIDPSFNYFSWGPEWQLLDMRDKLVASREQPGHCWPCAHSGVTQAGAEQHYYYLTMFCQPGCSSHPSYYPITSEQLRHRCCYLYQAPVSAWRALGW